MIQPWILSQQGIIGVILGGTRPGDALMNPETTTRYGLRAHKSLAARNETSGPVAGSVVQANVINELTVERCTPAEQPHLAKPRQLPPPPHAFVNRHSEIARIDSAMSSGESQGGATIVVLTGMGGVGKTACALHWAHRNAERFDGGLLHVDLDAYRHRGGVAINDVVAAFLWSLGVPWGYIPPHFSERVAQFRSLTAHRRVLVLLDNADHAAQVRALVPGSTGSVVIVTSRRRLSGLAIDGGQNIEVRPLDSEHGVSLVSRMVSDGRAEQDPSSVRRLVGLCAGLPIALRVVGAELGRLDLWSMARYAQHLADDRKRLSRLSVEGDHLVAHVFDAAFGDLPKDVKRLYRLLGWHPGPEFSVAAAAAVAEITTVEADRLLGVLRNANLLAEVSPDRYRFHDLVRLHARDCAEQKWGPRERSVVARRTIRWYLLGAAAADRAVMGESRWRLAQHDTGHWSIPFDADSGMTWFETERTNLLAAVRLAAELDEHDVAWQLCEALWALYHSRKHYADWIEAHQIGVEAAVRAGQREAEGRLRNQLARAHVELRDFAAARAEIERAQRVASEDGLVRAMVHESFGLLLREEGRFTDAARSFDAALGISRELGDHRAIGIQGYQLGDALLRAGETAQALATLQEAHAVLANLGDEMATARVNIALGKAYEALHRRADARSVLVQAVMTTRSRQQPVKEAQALEVLVGVAREEHDEGLWQNSARRLYELYVAAGNPRSAEVRSWLGTRG